MSERKTASGFTEFIHNLRGALPYLEEFHKETFVIKISGNTLQQQSSGVLDDLVLLYRVGIKIILVHGATPQIQEILKFHEKTGRVEEGRLIVDESLLPLIQQAIASANWDLMTRLNGYGDDIIPFSSHYVQAEKKVFPHITEDYFTGSVCDINTKALQQATDQGYLPIIPPFAIGEQGRLWILDPNQVALEIAARLRARKLIILTEELGFEETNLSHIQEMTTDDMKQWIEEHKKISDNLRLSLGALIEACERGVERCHLLRGSVDGSLLAEVLTSTGVGTMITNRSHTKIRSARLSDVHMIMDILGQPMQDKAVISRSPLYLEQHIANFLVFCIDEELIGCCELVPYEENQSMEIACLAVNKAHRNGGIGRQLVFAALNQAKEERKKLVFALSSQRSHVFLRSGFKEISPEQLPEKKRINYDYEDSLVYARNLNDNSPT